MVQEDGHSVQLSAAAAAADLCLESISDEMSAVRPFIRDASFVHRPRSSPSVSSQYFC